LPGAVSLTIGLVLLLLAITMAPARGWNSATVLASGVLGAASLASFVVIERRDPQALVPLGVVTRRSVLVPNLALALQSMVGIGWLYLLSLYFQQVQGSTALATGLLFFPMTVASIAGAGCAGRIAPRLGPSPTAVLGLTMVSAGLALMALGVAMTAIPIIICGMIVGKPVSCSRTCRSPLPVRPASRTSGRV
jgi:hypothetical protein